MTDWITDRRPTALDADLDGDVQLRDNRSDDGDYVYVAWEYVAEGAPWRPLRQRPEAIEIPEPIGKGVKPFYVLVLADDEGGRFNYGRPIVWETQIPEGSSLQAVLQQQSRVGSRYGTTFVAECRIIPELTRKVLADA